MTGDARYLRFVMFADPRRGSASLSWRLKACLEAQGHTVLWLDRRVQPHAFAREGVVRAYMARALLARQRPDCVILADGVAADYPEGLAGACGAPVGALVEGAGQARAACGLGGLSFAVACGAPAGLALEEGGFPGPAYRLDPLPDAAFLASPLANSVARGRGFLCLQDATPERAAALRALKDLPGMASSPMRCAGEGWPSPWRVDPSWEGMAYAAKSTHTVVAFGGGPDAPCEHALALALASGARGVSLGGAPSGAFEDAPDPASFAAAARASALAPAPAAAGPGPLLDGAAASLVSSLRADFGLEGSPRPRTVVCVYGFLGRGNYANEHILSTVEERIRARIEGSTVIALSMNPQHTLEHRGIYALGIEDKFVLDKAIESSSAVLVIAGLLVDQGVRWGMGKAEILSSMRGCDVYSIAALSMLSSLNDTEMVFYGVGAGPLDLGDARRLVRLMGTLDAAFIARDEATACLFERADVPADQIMVKADPAFLGSFEKTAAVDAWLEAAGLDLSSEHLLAVVMRSGEGVPASFPRRLAAALDAALGAFPSMRLVFCLMGAPDVEAVDGARLYLDNGGDALVFDAGDDEKALSDLLSRAHAGVSMQYYGTLAMARAGVACLGVGLQEREAGLYVDLGCEGISLSADVSQDELTACLLDMLANRGAWASAVSRGAARLKERALEAENYVVDVLAKAAAAKSGPRVGELYLHTRSVSDRELDKVEEKLRGAIRKASDERDEARRSRVKRAYRLGRALTYIPRKLGL